MEIDALDCRVIVIHYVVPDGWEEATEVHMILQLESENEFINDLKFKVRLKTLESIETLILALEEAKQEIFKPNNEIQ